MTAGGRIKTRKVDGQHNEMAICSECDRDATQTRISRYCVRALDHAPLKCDECLSGPK